MIDLHGKTLIFGDLHLGIKNDSLSRLFIDIKFINYILDYIKKNSINNIIFLGDWFNSRESINTITLSVGYELVSLLAKNVKDLVFILGNHDLESNSYQNATSVIGYDSIRNVHLIKEPTEGILNGQLALFVPWGFSNIDANKRNNNFKYIFGHLNLPSSYIRFNKITTNNLESIKDQNLLLNDIRTFCNYLDIGGVCFSGHIHCRTEQTYHQNRIIFVGSPFEMSYGETNSPHGFYIIDNTNTIHFNEINNESIPRHIILKLSSCFNDVDGKIKTKDELNYLKGNIVKKIIDKDLSASESMKLNDVLNGLGIYEFAQTEYGSLNSNYFDNEQEMSQTETSALTIDSYFDTVIQALDEETLKNSNVTKDELKECFLSYVKRLIDQNG